MPWTRTQLDQQVFSLLSETTNSTVAAIIGTPGGAADVSASAQLAVWLDEAAYRLARMCWYIPGRATWSAWAANAKSYQLLSGTGRLTNASGDDGSLIWNVERASWAGSLLEPWDKNRLMFFYPNLEEAAATPTAWYQDGEYLNLYKVPNAQGAVVAYGAMIPPPVPSTGSTSITWLNDREAWLMARYAAGQYALKGMDDDILRARAPIWLMDFDKEVRRRWEQIPVMVKKRHYPEPPIPITPGVSIAPETGT